VKECAKLKRKLKFIILATYRSMLQLRCLIILAPWKGPPLDRLGELQSRYKWGGKEKYSYSAGYVISVVYPVDSHFPGRANYINIISYRRRRYFKITAIVAISYSQINRTLQSFTSLLSCYCSETLFWFRDVSMFMVNLAFRKRLILSNINT
jgi:hypothetical protein